MQFMFQKGCEFTGPKSEEGGRTDEKENREEVLGGAEEEMRK